MTPPAAGLAALRARGVALTVQDGRLHVRAPAGALTPTDRAWLARHRDALLALLASEGAPRPDTTDRNDTIRAGRGGPLLVPRPCARCGWPTTVGALCLRCRHGEPPRCRACGGQAWWRPRPEADPAYEVCAVCHPPPDAPPARPAVVPPTPPPAPPPDRQGHRRCVGGCGRYLPADQAFCGPGFCVAPRPAPRLPLLPPEDTLWTW